ncbi:asparaginase domain-containing protein [Pokkaliibacter sp. CJK22405]|uniref:asparaginase domain-containing protein n=1 Tax=Pokkaliibacter sp. CJK22405 TaxID=3384615 RepID=UPI0039851FD3
MSKRLYVAYTGGTIGMQPSNAGFIPAANFLQKFFDALPEQSKDGFSFTFNEYEHLIDSSNATPADWLTIARDIQHAYDHHDAFLILHGTDTMSYTASALSFWLQGLDKPVIVSGSQIPYCMGRTDAISNVVNTLTWLKEDALSEVAVVFHDRLLRGNASSKVDATQMAAFDSPNQPWLGQLAISAKADYRRWLTKPIHKPTWQLPSEAHNNVAMLRIYPGMNVKLIQAALDSDETRGLILLGYGVGNAPDADLALMNTFSHYSARGRIICVLSQCAKGTVSATYAAGARLAECGVIAGGNMTPEAAFTKLHVLLSQENTAEAVKQQMQINLCGEMG